jgi:glycerophosphoryl diester phosphodiesterase
MRILGHRGSPRRAPENTIAAFEAALEAGADGVELDCRMTKDGVLVVRHDDELDAGGEVSGLAFERVHALAPDLPTLAAALDAVAAALCVVELKSFLGRNDELAERVAGTLASRVGRQRLVVSSFDASLLRAFKRRLGPGIPTALLFAFAVSESDVRWALDEAAGAGHAEIHAERHLVLGDLGGVLMDGANALGLEVVGWTVNRPAEAREMAARGVAGVITDVPGELVGQAGI